MAKAVEIRGLGKFQRFLLNLAPKTKRGIIELTETTGRLMESEMKSLAKVDTGKMRQSIHYKPTLGGLGAALSVNVAYWAYIEFGTGGEVDIPLGFEEFAAQFRGQGKRTVNIPPQPFVIPVYMKYQKVYYERVERLLNNILRW